MKKILTLAGILFALVVLVAIALRLLIDFDAHKPGIEAAASDALGMEVRILGSAAVRLFPSLGASFNDVRVRRRDSDVARAASLRVGVRLLPLLRRKVEVAELLVDQPDILLERGKDGRFNFEAGRRVPPSSPAFSVEKGTIRKGRLVYVDDKSGSRTEVEGIDLTVIDLSLSDDRGGDLLRGVAFSGTFQARTVRAGRILLEDVRAGIGAGGGVVRIRPLRMRLFDGTGEGEIEADLSGRSAVAAVRVTLSNVRVEQALSARGGKTYASGPVSLSSSLTLRGNDARAMKRTVTGTVSLRGENLSLRGLDIDAALSKAEKSRSFDLADVGAFVLAGPLGAAATRGFRFGEFYAAAKGDETRITRLVSEWSIRDGVARAQDVAFTTRKHRIALRGELDLPGERFVGIEVGALDAKGCARLRQRISGSFRSPTLDKVSILESATAPLLGLLEQTKKLLAPGTCTPFYEGTVAHPG